MKDPGEIIFKSFDNPDERDVIVDKYTVSKPLALSGDISIL